MGPASDYTPFTLNDDTTRGGYARLATLIAKRKAGAQGSGPGAGARRAVTTAWGPRSRAAIRETGGELQLMSRMGYDATTFGNHEFDLGPDGTAQVHRGGRQGGPGSGGGRVEYQLRGE